MAVIIIIFLGVITYLKTRTPSEEFSEAPLSYADQSQRKVWRDNYFVKSTGESFGYELRYPRDFDLYRGDQASGGLLPDSTAVEIKFPEDAFQTPKTNYGEAFVSVSLPASVSPEACYIGPDAKPLVRTAVINGVEFKTATTTGVGAGQIYDSKYYRIVRNGRCFEIAETVHTGNIGMYPPGNVSEFDKSKAFNILDEIAGSFRFE